MTIKNINKLKVSFNFGNSLIDVGEMVMDKTVIYFRYFESFLALDLNISPIKLKFNTQIQTVDNQVFSGLFGVFYDSLPDGWGRLLLDRKLMQMGMGFSDINPIQRLAIIGENGPGALVYQPMLDDESAENQAFELDKLAIEANKILQDEPSNSLDNLFKLGGSSGGARPKINVGVDENTFEIFYGSKNMPSNFEHWLVKFPSSYDNKNIANIEFAYYLMALDAGLTINYSHLFEGKKAGNYYFGTKRFDRNGEKRTHLHSAAGLLHDNFRLSNIDYGHLMECTFRLEKNVAAYDKILRLAAFNIFTHNRDDHSKNVSYLMDSAGTWQLAPVYDLTFSNSSHGYHSISVAGESKNPTEKHIEKLAKNFGVKNVSNIIEQVKSVVNNWNFYAEKARINKQTKDRIGKVVIK